MADEKEYKVRDYYRSGVKKGMIRKERFFDTLEEAEDYYNSVFVYKDYSYNATIWKRQGGKYVRLPGF